MASSNESDKDLLFSKLLPALNNNPFSSTYAGKKPDTAAVAPSPEGDSGGDSLSALRSRLFARSDDYSANSYSTINLMENLVLEHLDAAIRRFNSCGCDKCRCEIAAYALNLLPPKYIVADPKSAQSLEKDIPLKPVLDALINAIIYVRAHPTH